MNADMMLAHILTSHHVKLRGWFSLVSFCQSLVWALVQNFVNADMVETNILKSPKSMYNVVSRLECLPIDMHRSPLSYVGLFCHTLSPCIMLCLAWSVSQ